MEIVIINHPQRKVVTTMPVTEIEGNFWKEELERLLQYHEGIQPGHYLIEHLSGVEYITRCEYGTGIIMEVDNCFWISIQQ